MVLEAFELFLIFPFTGTPTLVPGPHSGHWFHPFWSRIPRAPWDRPDSNRLMTPPIFDALLVITYTFSRYMLKMKNVYLPILFQNQVYASYADFLS